MDKKLDNIGIFVICVVFVSLGYWIITSVLFKVSDLATQLDYSIIIGFLAYFAVRRKNTQHKDDDD